MFVVSFDPEVNSKIIPEPSQVIRDIFFAVQFGHIHVTSPFPHGSAACSGVEPDYA